MPDAVFERVGMLYLSHTLSLSLSKHTIISFGIAMKFKTK